MTPSHLLGHLPNLYSLFFLKASLRGTVSSGSVAFHSTSICCSAWNLIPSLSSRRWILSRYLLWTILETFSTNNFSPRVSSRVFCKYDIAKWDHKILTRVPGHRQLFVVLVCLLLGKYHPEKKNIDLILVIKSKNKGHIRFGFWKKKERGEEGTFLTAGGPFLIRLD